MAMPDSRSIFSLQQAQALLPQVRQLTDRAVDAAHALNGQLEVIPESDPDHARLSDALRAIVNGWVEEVQALGLEAKGLWLVDFDNGEGYYCWRYPEESVGHYHGYEDGFAGRMRIQ